MKKSKLSIVTLGCNKNLVDSEKIIFALENDYDYTDNPADSDVLIINTCGFIDSAKQQNVDAIIEAVHSKKKFGINKVIAMGCLTQRYAEQIKSQIDGIDAVFGVNNHQEIIDYLLVNDSQTDANNPLKRHLLTPPHFAYLKISEGCSHKCSFCAIPNIRGKHRSVPIDELLLDAERIKAIGTKEIILIAQDTSYYGTDMYGQKRLAELLSKISDMKFDWIRLMYAYPTSFPMDVLEIMADRENICKYIDVPLQHISDRILKSMNRGIGKLETIKFVEKLKSTVPNLAIRSTFIVGYPGETEQEFTELMKFLKDAELDRVGAFQYSKEEDTTSFELVDNVKIKIKNSRLDKLMIQQMRISLKKNKSKIGRKLKVLVEEIDDKYYIARTEHDAPEVDNTVLIDKHAKLEIGEFAEVTIKKASEFDLFG